jgi:cyclic di-GMP phosphodiesterase
MATKVLVVDDESLIRMTLTTRLEETGYDCVEAEDGESALSAVDSDPDIDIVLADIKMPRISGLEMVERLRQHPSRNVEVIIMTGDGGVDEAVRALRLGASDFLQKPFEFDQLCKSLEKCSRQLRERIEQVRIRQELEHSVEIKTNRVRELIDYVDSAQIETVASLAIAAEHRDDDTGAHIKRIGEYSAHIANLLKLENEEVLQIRFAGMLHDVGKIGVPDNILLKPGKLTVEEIRIMQAHTVIGHQITSQAHNPIMRRSAEIALSHHERWDGSGYPNGISGEEIPIAARIVAIADVYDALRSERPYKRSLSHEETLRIMMDGDGRTDPKHFDPDILYLFSQEGDAFQRIFAEMPNQGPVKLATPHPNAMAPKMDGPESGKQPIHDGANPKSNFTG